MDAQDLQSKVERAKELLATVNHAAMATVNEDGSPHNTPYFFMCSDTLEHLYWSSHPGSLHSQNVDRTGQVFVVLYGANAGGGLYIQAGGAYVAEGVDLDAALSILNKMRAKAGKDPQTAADFSGDNSGRLYVATVQKLWVNGSGKNKAGDVVKDQRHEVAREDLL